MQKLKNVGSFLRPLSRSSIFPSSSVSSSSTSSFSCVASASQSRLSSSLASGSSASSSSPLQRSSAAVEVISRAYEQQMEDVNEHEISEINGESASQFRTVFDHASSHVSAAAPHLPVSFQDVEDARRRIALHIRKTPLQFSYRLSQMTENRVFLKFENLQMTGAYKERGALNKLMTLTDEEKRRGVICASAGNHAQGVSYQATRMGIDATIVMPVTTPLSKVSGTARWGAKVVLHGMGYDDAYAEACRLMKEEGRTFVHAFNDPAIVAGQGTCGLEILEQNPYLDAVICPIGGGGLIAGIALVLKEINPRIKIYGVETREMAGMKVSIDQGSVTEVPFSRTIADGIAVKKVGDVPFSICRHLLDDIVTVDEDEIASAILTLLEVEKTIVEGAGGTALAALLSGKLPLKNKRVAVVCTGGNIDPSVLGKIIDRGLVKDGRLARISVTVVDGPGQLAAALKVVAEMGCNIREVDHERSYYSPVGYTTSTLTLESKGHSHLKEVKEALRKQGFAVQLEQPDYNMAVQATQAKLNRSAPVPPSAPVTPPSSA